MTYEEIKESVKDQELPIFATLSDGSNATIYAFDEGYAVKVGQENGWFEVTHYHSDGTVETSYEK